MSVNPIAESSIIKETERKIIYNPSLYKAFKQAQEYAGENGFVASMPQLCNTKLVSDKYDALWREWFTLNSEEDVGKTPQGTRVVIVVHGGGILTPERVERAVTHNELTAEYAAKFTDAEVKDLLKGKLPDGTNVPIYSIGDFKKGIKDLPVRYGVVIDLKDIKEVTKGVDDDCTKNMDLFTARMGGEKETLDYITKTKEVHDLKKVGLMHPFGSIDINQPQGRLLFNGYLSYYGLKGDGTFIAVRPETPKGQGQPVQPLEKIVQ